MNLLETVKLCCQPQDLRTPTLLSLRSVNNNRISSRIHIPLLPPKSALRNYRSDLTTNLLKSDPDVLQLVLQLLRVKSELHRAPKLLQLA